MARFALWKEVLLKWAVFQENFAWCKNSATLLFSSAVQNYPVSLQEEV